MVSRQTRRIYSNDLEGPSESYYIRKTLNFKATGINTPSSYDKTSCIIHASVFCLYYFCILIAIKFTKGVLQNELLHFPVIFSVFSAVYIGVPILYSFCIANFFDLNEYVITFYRLYCYASLYNYILFPIKTICDEYLPSNDFTKRLPRIIFFIADLLSAILWYINIDKALIYKTKRGRFLLLVLSLMLFILYSGLAFIDL